MRFSTKAGLVGKFIGKEMRLKFITSNVIDILTFDSASDIFPDEFHRACQIIQLNENKRDSSLLNLVMADPPLKIKSETKSLSESTNKFRTWFLASLLA
jgi:hypothetical protein